MATMDEATGGALALSISTTFASMRDNYTRPPQLQCMRTYTTQNTTKTYYIYNGYSGIPENLVLNAVLWTILFIVFILVRKYVIYPEEKKSTPQPQGWWIYRRINAWLGWIPTVLKLQDQHISKKCGPDALLYLVFQRYLLTYTAFVTFLSLLIGLPTNFQGHLAEDFGKTTIANVEGNSSLLWIHSTLAAIYMLVAILMFRRFTTTYLISRREKKINRTLLIANVPTKSVTHPQLHNFFRDNFTDISVHSVNSAYDVTELISLNESRRYTQEVRLQAENMHGDTGGREEMYPYPCCACCCCCCYVLKCTCCGNRCCRKVDAITYYTKEETRLYGVYERRLELVLGHPLDIVFITFYSEAMAVRVYNAFNKWWRLVCFCPGLCPHGSSIRARKWYVDFAPPAADIYWENLATNRLWWWTKATILNLGLFILLFLFTTPSVIMNLLDEWHYKETLEGLNNPFLVNVVPVLLLTTFSILLPAIIYLVEVIIGHWTRSTEQRTIMVKTFTLLLLMVLILPSVGLTSAQGLMSWLTGRDDEEQQQFRWACVFLPDNGAFFVNYVITSGMLGIMVQMLRIPALLLLCVKLLWARSAAERAIIRKFAPPPVPFGTLYAWLCCVFTMIMSYSVICPLITPFGLLYMVMRHLADRHHLFYVFKPSGVSSGPHERAVNFVYTGIIMLQIWLIIFTTIRANGLYGPAIFTLLVLVLGVSYLTGDAIITWLRAKMKQLKEGMQNDGKTEMMMQDHNLSQMSQYPYVPDVLLASTSPRSLVMQFPQAHPETI